MLFRTSIIFIFVLVAGAQAGEKPDFMAEVEKAMTTYKEFFEAQNKLAQNDRLLEANAELMKRANAEKSPVFDFIVANKLYDMDPEGAYQLHERVIKALPTVPEINLEWAMVCHRRGEIQSAIPAYELFLKTTPEHPTQWALLADCYVRAGKYDQAIEAWKKARHGSNHTGIDFAIYSIYGGVNALRKRADLILALEKGDVSVLEELILKDLHFQDDWWNLHVYSAGLDRDLARAERALGKDTRRYKELAALAEIRREKEIDGKKLQAQLKALHILIDGGDFPVNSVIGSYFIALATELQLVDMKDLAKNFSKEMETRARSKEGDAEALNILCVYYSAAEDWKRVKELDRYGWERYKEARFATSLIREMVRDDTLKIDSPELKRALVDFPENNFFWMVRMGLLEANRTVEDAAGAIKAEYRELSTGIGGYKDSYTLKGYFVLLEKLRKQ